MLKEAVASKAAKLLMTCVCPVAGTTALSLGVPQVRDAVYKATQPRQYAKPKTRIRQQNEEAGVEVAQNSACPPVSPFHLDDLPKVPPETPPGSPPSTPPSPPPDPPTNPPYFPPRPPSGPPESPGVPEPSTWLQLLVGFGLIGGVIRVSYRRNAGQGEDCARRSGDPAEVL